MDRTTLRKIAQDRLFALQGDEFQDFVDRLCLKLHPDDYQPVRAGGPKGDMKNDGYCPKARIFYAAHATRGSRVTDIKRKIKGDLSGCLSQHRDVKHWIFITNDDKFVGEVETFIDEELRPVYISEESALDTIESWGTVRITDKMLNGLPQHAIEEILGLNFSDLAQQDQKNINVGDGAQFNNQVQSIGSQIGTQIINNNYNHNAQSEIENQEIITALLENVLEMASASTSELLPEDYTFVEIGTKIKINFDSREDQERIRDYVIACYEYLSTVERSYKNIETFFQKVIKHKVKSDYDELKEKGLENIQVFSELSQKYNIRNDETHFFLSRCLVVFFFDDCTIFEKTDHEKTIQATQLPLISL